MVKRYIIIPEIASFFRHISAFFVLLPFIIRTLERNPHHLVHKVPHKIMIFRAVCYTFATFTWPIVYTHIPLHIAMTIAFLVPFLSNILLRYFLNEIIPSRVWYAKIIAFIGVVIILEPHINKFDIYYILAFFAVVVWAIATVLNKAIANRGVRPNIALYYLMLYSIIFTGMLIYGLKISITHNFWKPFLMLGFISVLSQWFTIKSYRVSKGYYINAFEFLRFLMFLACDIILFGANLTLMTVFGSIIIGMSVLYIVRGYKG